MYTEFNKLDKRARLWVYQADRAFNEAEKELILERGKAFVESWTAHNKALIASIEIKYNQFIILAVDETKAAATGCSIDKSVHFVRLLEDELKINLLDKSKIAFLKDDEVVLENLSSIKSKIESEDIEADSLVFNNMVTDKAQFDANWIISAANSWMGRYFQLKV